MHQSVHCPACGSQIRIPEILEGQANPPILVCENCNSEFNFDEENQVEEQPNPTMTNELELEMDSDDSSEVDRVALVSDEEKSESPTETDWSLLGESVSRRKIREVSALRKIVPPILGGLAAFPIATLIMWYGFGKDIGTAGPAVARYAPWIVPEKLRNDPWEYSGRRSGGTRKDTSSKAELPSLNREKSVESLPASDRVSQPKTDRVAVPDLPAVADIETKIEPLAETPISATIVKLRDFQRDWDSTPKADKPKMVGDFYQEVSTLSRQSAELRGRSSAVWRKELEALSREIFSHQYIPKAIQYCSAGSLPGMAYAKPGDFIATVLLVGEGNEPNTTESWRLREKWTSGTAELPVEIAPTAWGSGLATLPASYLLLGRLVKNEAAGAETTESESIVQVHLVLPSK